MKMLPLIRPLAFTLWLLIGSTASGASTSKLESLNENTFAITRTATTGFDRDADKFKREAQEDAAKYCAAQGKVMKVVAITADRPHIGGGYTSAKIVFQALEAGDPLLTAPVPATNAASSLGPNLGPAPGPLPTYAGDLYAELLKLDDLRKRGLLTDKEFESEKKKLLKRSK